MIDTHCHLTHRKFDGDVDQVIARARAAGVSCCVTIGTGIDDALRTQELAKRHAGIVYATAGLDPFTTHALGERFDEALEQLDALLSSRSFVAVGEIGLDYHYELDPKPLQAERFERQLDLAARHDLPVVIHVRDAHEDMMRILASRRRNHGVIHSFTAGPAEAEAYLSIGWLLAFNGVLTFKNAESVREAARLAPIDRILVETDSPYLAPAPARGVRCEPAFVARTLHALSAARGEEIARVDQATTQNARRLFRIGEEERGAA